MIKLVLFSRQLLLAVDGYKYVSLMTTFGRLYTAYVTDDTRADANILLSDDDKVIVDEYKPENCMRVRKLIITPTREILMPPDVMMGNRVLRKFKPEFALRLSFRDEDGSKMHVDANHQNLFTVCCLNK